MKKERSGVLWTTSEVAEYLGISELQAKTLLENGDIQSFNLLSEKRLRTTQKAVDNWLNRILKTK